MRFTAIAISTARRLGRALVALAVHPGWRHWLVKLPKRLLLQHPERKISRLAFFGILLALTLLGWEVFSARGIMVQPLGVPEDLAKRGLTSAVATEQMLDSLAGLRQQAREQRLEAQRQLPLGLENALVMRGNEADLGVPGGGLSVKSLAYYLRSLLGLPQIVVGGELTCLDPGECPPERMVATVRVDDNEAPPDRQRWSETQSPAPWPDSAEAAAGAVLRRLYPGDSLRLPGAETFRHDLVAWHQDMLSRGTMPPPRRAEHLRDLAEALMDSERCSEALPLLQDAVALVPTHQDILWDKIHCLARLDRFEESIDQADILVRRIAIEGSRTEQADAHVQQFYPYIFARRYGEALEIAREAIRLDLNNVAAHNDACVALILLDRYEEALEICIKVIEINPSHSAAYSNACHSLNNLGRYGEALDYCEHAIRLAPHNDLTHANTCYSLYHLGQQREALAECREALRLKTKNKWAKSFVEHHDKEQPPKPTAPEAR